MPIFSNKENVQVECTQIYKNMWHGPKYISEYDDLSTSIIMIIYWITAGYKKKIKIVIIVFI